MANTNAKAKELLEKHIEQLLLATDSIVNARRIAKSAIDNAIGIIDVQNYSNVEELKDIKEIVLAFKEEQPVEKMIKIASFISTVSNNCIDVGE